MTSSERFNDPSRQDSQEDESKSLESIRQLLEKESGRRLLMQITQVSRSEFSMQQYSSPLPPPELLTQYQEMIPDAPERILALTGAQAKHRRVIERKVIDGDVVRAKLGLFLGFAMGIAVLLLAAYMTSKGSATSASTMVIAVIVALVGVFVFGSISRKIERRERRENVLTSDTPRGETQA